MFLRLLEIHVFEDESEISFCFVYKAVLAVCVVTLELA